MKFQSPLKHLINKIKPIRARISWKRRQKSHFQNYFHSIVWSNGKYANCADYVNWKNTKLFFTIIWISPYAWAMKLLLIDKLWLIGFPWLLLSIFFFASLFLRFITRNIQLLTKRRYRNLSCLVLWYIYICTVVVVYWMMDISHFYGQSIIYLIISNTIDNFYLIWGFNFWIPLMSSLFVHCKVKLGIILGLFWIEVREIG